MSYLPPQSPRMQPHPSTRWGQNRHGLQIVRKLPMEAGSWYAPLTFRVLAVSNLQDRHPCKPAGEIYPHLRPPLFCISKESPPIPNSLEAHTSHTFPLSQFPLFWKRQLTSPTLNFVISPNVSTHKFCDKNREIKLATPRKWTGTSAAGVLHPNHHTTKGNCLMQFYSFL